MPRFDEALAVCGREDLQPNAPLRHHGNLRAGGEKRLRRAMLGAWLRGFGEQWHRSLAWDAVLVDDDTGTAVKTALPEPLEAVAGRLPLPAGDVDRLRLRHVPGHIPARALRLFGRGPRRPAGEQHLHDLRAVAQHGEHEGRATGGVRGPQHLGHGLVVGPTQQHADHADAVGATQRPDERRAHGLGGEKLAQQGRRDSMCLLQQAVDKENRPLVNGVHQRRDAVLIRAEQEPALLPLGPGPMHDEPEVLEGDRAGTGHGRMGKASPPTGIDRGHIGALASEEHLRPSVPRAIGDGGRLLLDAVREGMEPPLRVHKGRPRGGAVRDELPREVERRLVAGGAARKRGAQGRDALRIHGGRQAPRLCGALCKEHGNEVRGLPQRREVQRRAPVAVGVQGDASIEELPRNLAEGRAVRRVRAAHPPSRESMQQILPALEALCAEDLVADLRDERQ
mmetsp:Transcript_29903/g.86013  ORF Transcript_29903/g.86013 Transcript_29903/m.86013 type:complete len:452 (+) Transcript_29903:1236-2591(+)